MLLFTLIAGTVLVFRKYKTYTRFKNIFYSCSPKKAPPTIDPHEEYIAPLAKSFIDFLESYHPSQRPEESQCTND